jgi:hypothetical protein
MVLTTFPRLEDTGAPCESLFALMAISADTPFAVEVLLPKKGSFLRIADPLELHDFFRTFATFDQGPGGIRVTLAAVRLPCKVNLADLASFEMTKLQCEPIETRVTTTKTGENLEVLYRTTNKEFGIYRIFMHSNICYRIIAQSAQFHRREIAGQCLWITSSLQTTGTPQNFPPPKYAGEGPELSLVSFEYDDCWHVASSSCSPKSSDYFLDLTAHDNFCGRIQVTCILKEQEARSTRQLLTELVHATSGSGFRRSGSLILPFAPPAYFDSGEYCTVKLEVRDANAELTAFAFDSQKYQMLLTTYGPTRDDSPVWWSVIKRAGEVVRNSTHIFEI